MISNIEKMKEYLARRISPEETCEDLLKFPRYLEIETINSCNAKCPMCPASDQPRNLKPMKDELFAKIADEIIGHKAEVKRVTLYRDGEPLLDNKLADRIALLKKHGIKATSISTNVSLLTESKAKGLLNAGIDIVIMSIDSLNKASYEAIRRGLDFDVVINNALKFIDIRNKIRPETQIWMRMIRQKSNYDEWPAYRKYWSQHLSKSDRIYFHDIFNWGGQLKNFKPVSKSFEPNLPCVALWSLFVIFCNGDVPLCNVDYRNMYPSGNVRSNSIARIWHSEVLNERRRAHLIGEKNRISLCGNCNVWNESADGKNISLEYAQEAAIKTP